MNFHVLSSHSLTLCSRSSNSNFILVSVSSLYFSWVTFDLALGVKTKKPCDSQKAGPYLKNKFAKASWKYSISIIEHLMKYFNDVAMSTLNNTSNNIRMFMNDKSFQVSI